MTRIGRVSPYETFFDWMGGVTLSFYGVLEN